MIADAEVVALQLGRPPRGLRRVAHRCPCGLPDVVETAPRLADGSPFPTLYYLTCPRAVAAVARLEAAGVMRQMQRDHFGIGDHRALPRFACWTDCHSRSYQGVRLAAADAAPRPAACPPMTT